MDSPSSSSDLFGIIVDGLGNRASTRRCGEAATSPQRSRQNYLSISCGCRAGTRKMWPRGARSSLALRVGSPALLYETWAAFDL